MIRRPPRSTPLYSSAASDVYKRQSQYQANAPGKSARQWHDNLGILVKPKSIHLLRMRRRHESVCTPNRTRLLSSERQRAKILRGLNTLIHSKVPSPRVDEQREGLRSLEVQAEAYRTAIPCTCLLYTSPSPRD
eukprot:TRINITY_DN2174_c0_g1_i16.p1 TRINITY_DN2174_c0_g1~~TRINITY_DN2174_c0_g1_i16.p1  ORF type:complete len:142 (+),score=37.41 TRINITY_DN2174_c0_g1_i16:25-426(+)